MEASSAADVSGYRGRRGRPPKPTLRPGESLAADGETRILRPDLHAAIIKANEHGHDAYVRLAEPGAKGIIECRRRGCERRGVVDEHRLDGALFVGQCRSFERTPPAPLPRPGMPDAFSPSVMPQPVARAATPPRAGERADVIAALREGLTTREVMDRCKVASETVAAHANALAAAGEVLRCRCGKWSRHKGRCIGDTYERVVEPVGETTMVVQRPKLPAPEVLDEARVPEVVGNVDPVEHYGAIAGIAEKLKDAAARRRRLEGELKAAMDEEQGLLDDLRELVAQHTV